MHRLVSALGSLAGHSWTSMHVRHLFPYSHESSSATTMVSIMQKKALATQVNLSELHDRLSRCSGIYASSHSGLAITRNNQDCAGQIILRKNVGVTSHEFLMGRGYAPQILIRS